eukprot:TRINITY_DN50299_c0_g1_i1.p1 TRINITY_DN50299_c0_g1~~TRINITY_DN50299_c0_g1_i1.p1  ORF type:complete len:315 (-),score=50.19 TRINITY_DN50299_c0_g1_i1:29-973(-)
MSKTCDSAMLQSVVDENLACGFDAAQAVTEAVEQLELSGYHVPDNMVGSLMYPSPPAPSGLPSQSANSPTSPAERIAAHMQTERLGRSAVVDRLQSARTQMERQLAEGKLSDQVLHSLDEQISKAVAIELQRPRTSRTQTSTGCRLNVSQPSSPFRPQSAKTQQRATPWQPNLVAPPTPPKPKDGTTAQERAAARCQQYRQVRRNYRVPGRQYTAINPEIKRISKLNRNSTVETVDEVPSVMKPRTERRRGVSGVLGGTRTARGTNTSAVRSVKNEDCLLYTSDAADEEDSVDLGGRRIIKKKKKEDDNVDYSM